MSCEIIKMNDNTWRIEDNNHVRFFLLTGEEKALLIDSGMTVSNAKDIAAELTDLPIELLNTHADPDHIASNHQFETFYMSSAEASNYYNVQKRQGQFIPVHEGDVMDLGNRPLEIISLAGHTPGSIGILDVNGRMLFSGDPIQDGMIFMFGQQREMHAYRASLKELMEMEDRFDTICPSHGTCPVDKEIVAKLYEVSADLRSGVYPSFPMNFNGKDVTCVDAGVAKYLLD
ncbi:MAG: MBL fold metallo-hydrolase [Eubacteriales bacterium]|nr:MBL fold metallo-hydrolase [Eubacteriales bacterium]